MITNGRKTYVGGPTTTVTGKTYVNPNNPSGTVRSNPSDPTPPVKPTSSWTQSRVDLQAILHPSEYGTTYGSVSWWEYTRDYIRRKTGGLI